jgi:RNA 3'-terminal phosphate cyclase
MIEIDGSYDEAGGQILPFLAVAEGESAISVPSLTVT